MKCNRAYIHVIRYQNLIPILLNYKQGPSSHTKKKYYNLNGKRRWILSINKSIELELVCAASPPPTGTWWNCREHLSLEVGHSHFYFSNPRTFSTMDSTNNDHFWKKRPRIFQRGGCTLARTRGEVEWTRWDQVMDCH